MKRLRGGAVRRIRIPYGSGVALILVHFPSVIDNNGTDPSTDPGGNSSSHPVHSPPQGDSPSSESADIF